MYRKAGLGFAALRAEIGDEAFFSGLQRYVESTRFEVGTPDDLQEAFERAAGRELDAFWHLWFETASGRVEIVMELATPAPATPAIASPVATPDAEGLALDVATPIVSPVQATPIATPKTATPEGAGHSDPLTDYASLVDALRASGLTVDIVDTVEQPFLQPESGTVLGLSGGELGQPAEIQVFEYRDAESAAADATQIGPDGNPPTMMISWLATPHFFQAERLIVLYVGDYQQVVDLLTELLGPQFAGG